MRTTRRVIQIAGVAAGAIGAVAATGPDNPAGRAARQLALRLARDIQYAAATAPGFVYRLAGRHPDPDVSDDVLADRVRSSIGALEKRLDIPHVHVMVENHVALLHGEVTDEHAARAVEHAVLHVSGVRDIESHLHVGLVSGDTRPSEGHTARHVPHASSAPPAAAR